MKTGHGPCIKITQYWFENCSNHSVINRLALSRGFVLQLWKQPTYHLLLNVCDALTKSTLHIRTSTLYLDVLEHAHRARRKGRSVDRPSKLESDPATTMNAANSKHLTDNSICPKNYYRKTTDFAETGRSFFHLCALWSTLSKSVNTGCTDGRNPRKQ